MVDHGLLIRPRMHYLSFINWPQLLIVNRVSGDVSLSADKEGTTGVDTCDIGHHHWPSHRLLETEESLLPPSAFECWKWQLPALHQVSVVRQTSIFHNNDSDGQETIIDMTNV